MNENSRMHAGRWGIIVYSAVFYVLLFLVLEPIIGPAVILLLAIPSVALTWDLGPAWGFMGGGVGTILSYLYLISINNFNHNFVYNFGILPGGIIIATVIIIVYFLRKRYLEQETELTARLNESNAFAEIAIALSETEHVGLSSVLQLILKFAKNLIHGTEQAVIHLLDENKEYLVPKALIGYETSVEGKRKMRLGEGIAGQAAASGESIRIGDAHADSRFMKLDPNSRTRSLIVVPIRSGTEMLGTISVQSETPSIFSHREEGLLSRLGTQASIAIENARLYAAAKSALQHEKDIRNQLIQNERLAIMGRLLATVSHELNNPLQAIQNALFLLKDEKGISAQGMQDLGIVLAESERMANLIERLRATYRPTHDEDFQPTQINKIITEVHQLVATHLRNRSVKFEFKPAESLPEIPALSAQIRQVALNLVMNAVDAMNEGGTLTIETKMLPDTDEVLMTVSDTGGGIAPQILPIVFEAFITNKQSGTGIGLTISHDIVIKHNGRITAENNPDKGATFKVWLPTKTNEAVQ